MPFKKHDITGNIFVTENDILIALKTSEELSFHMDYNSY